jgi:hypothetical protein
MATVQALLGSDFPNAAVEEEERGINNGQSSDADLIGHGRVEEEDLQKLKAMDFISINSKCPLASVQETYVSFASQIPISQNSGFPYRVFCTLANWSFCSLKRTHIQDNIYFWCPFIFLQR